MCFFTSTWVPNAPAAPRGRHPRHCFRRSRHHLRQCFRRLLWHPCRRLCSCRLLHGFTPTVLFVRALLHAFTPTVLFVRALRHYTWFDEVLSHRCLTYLIYYLPVLL